MIYIQFFHKSLLDPTKIIEACGDRSVVILDGRESKLTHMRIAQQEGVKRGYVAYQFNRGESFMRSLAFGPIYRVNAND